MTIPKNIEKSLEVDRFYIRLFFISPILGTAPSPNVLMQFYSKKQMEEYAKAYKDIQKLHTDIREIQEKAYTPEFYTVPEEDDDTKKTYFRRDEEGIYIPNFMVKGFLKEAGNTFKEQLGIKNMRNKINKFLFVFPNKIRLYRNGEIIREADGDFVRPLRASTPKGERISIVRSEIIDADESNPVETDIIEIVLFGSEIGKEDIEVLLDYGQFMGISQFRNGGFGRFEWDYMD